MRSRAAVTGRSFAWVARLPRSLISAAQPHCPELEREGAVYDASESLWDRMARLRLAREWMCGLDSARSGRALRLRRAGSALNQRWLARRMLSRRRGGAFGDWRANPGRAQQVGRVQ